MRHSTVLDLGPKEAGLLREQYENIAGRLIRDGLLLLDNAEIGKWTVHVELLIDVHLAVDKQPATDQPADF